MSISPPPMPPCGPKPPYVAAADGSAERVEPSGTGAMRVYRAGLVGSAVTIAAIVAMTGPGFAVFFLLLAPLAWFAVARWRSAPPLWVVWVAAAGWGLSVVGLVSIAQSRSATATEQVLLYSAAAATVVFGLLVVEAVARVNAIGRASDRVAAAFGSSHAAYQGGEETPFVATVATWIAPQPGVRVFVDWDGPGTCLMVRGDRALAAVYQPGSVRRRVGSGVQVRFIPAGDVTALHDNAPWLLDADPVVHVLRLARLVDGATPTW